MPTRPAPAPLTFRSVTATVLSATAIAAGVGALVGAGWGVDPYDVAVLGIADTAGIGVTTAAWLCGAVLLVSALAWVRPRLGTAVNVGCIGALLPHTIAAATTAAETASWSRPGLLVAGTALLAFGTAVAVAADAGVGPVEAAGIATSRLTGWTEGRALTVVYVAMVAGGALAGGPVGLATPAVTVAVGPIVDRLLPVARRRIHPPRRS